MFMIIKLKKDIDNSDDTDVLREIRNMFFSYNILTILHQQNTYKTVAFIVNLSTSFFRKRTTSGTLL